MADDLALTLDGMDWLGVLLAALASFLIGFVWYTPLFGKTWARLMGMDPDSMDMKPKDMAWRMGLNLLGAALTAYVLWHMATVWIPSVWAEHLGAGPVEDSATWLYGVYAGVFAWLGFFVPMGFSKVSWENPSWALFGINAGHDLVRLLAMGLILVSL